MATIAAPVEHHDAEEALLTRRACDGDGEAFAALYDRYEQRVHNLCYRLLNSRDDAADATQEAFVSVLERLPKLADRRLSFGSYVFTAARNECYDLIARRRRALPAEQPALEAGVAEAARRDPGTPAADPARSALIVAQQEEIRRANAQLPVRQREALALRELGELSYDEIGALMGMKRNAVAQLISRARLNLREALRRSAVGAIASAGPDCARALPLIAMRDDRELADAGAAAWLCAHLHGCASCRATGEALAEAGASYRAWAPIAAAAWLLDDTIAKAAARNGAGAGVGSGAGAAAGARARRLVGAGAVALVVLLVALAGTTGDAQTEDGAAQPIATPPAPAPQPATPVAARTARPQPQPRRRAAGGATAAPRTAPPRLASKPVAAEVPTAAGTVKRRTPSAGRAPAGRAPAATAADRPGAAGATAPADPPPDPEPATTTPTAVQPPPPLPPPSRPPAGVVTPRLPVRPPPPPARPPPPPRPPDCRDASGAPIPCPPR